MKDILPGGFVRSGPQLPAHFQRCRGGLLVETLVAVVAFTLVGTAVLTGVSTAQISGAKFEGQSFAENAARNQMEYIFDQPYQPPPHSYATIDPPRGYTISATAEELVPGDLDIERVVVVVTRGAVNILTLETLRVRS